MSLFLQNQYIY